MTDKRVLRIITVSSFIVLLFAFLLPGASSGRITASVLLVPLSAITWFYIKKRSILSINKREVTMLMGLIGVVYIVLYYLTGINFGFFSNPYWIDFSYIVPVIIIIVSTEINRYVVRAQNTKNIDDVLCYLTCVIAEVLVFGTVFRIRTFNNFMDFVGITLFPAIIANLLYHYLSKRYGMYPNIVYRLITTLYAYLIPVVPALPDSLFAFANLFIPILIYLFVDALYEKKRRYALAKKSRFAPVITGLAVAIMAAFVMLISNQFKYGALVIATESMTGEIDKGDAAIFEEYTGQVIKEGQVIVFEKNDSVVVHRVTKIENIDGVVRYTTKGDANEDVDAGYITSGQIMGLVSFKIPYVGYPTLWLRSLFSN